MGKPRIDNPLFINTEKQDLSQAILQESTTLNSSELQNLKTSEVNNLRTSELEVQKLRSSELPKFRTLEPVTVRLRKDHLDLLEKLSKKIIQSRGPGTKKERITKNTIIRACLDTILSLEIDTKEIPDEGELLSRILTKAKGKGYGTT